VRSYVLNVDAQITTHHFAVRHDLVHHILRQADRNREADALIAAASTCENSGVDSHQIAMQIDHRAARISRVDRSVGLDEVFVILDTQSAASCGANDSHRGRFADSEWIANRKHEIAHMQGGRVTQRKRRQTVGIDLQHCDVRLRIGADELSLKFTLVAQLHFDIGSAVNHVIVRQNRAVRGKNHARAEALFAFRPRLRLSELIAKKLAEKWIVAKGIHSLLLLHHFGCVDVDHRGKRGFQHGRKPIGKATQTDRQRFLGHRHCHRRGAHYCVARPVLER